MPKKILTQIYEIQTPSEAEWMLSAGVDHVGSVLLSESDWKKPRIRETILAVQSGGARSSLIPLFNTPDTVFEALDYYGPDMVHFCETLPLDPGNDDGFCERLLAVQEGVRQRYGQIQIMRSIPIAPPGMADSDRVLALARLFEPLSDWFLTDTLCVAGPGEAPGEQPVSGFVGITGKTCDWTVAARLVRDSTIPVILAGGLSPENVCQGCLAVAPAGVDSCTLTNALDGNKTPVRFKKDPQRVRRFVAETRRAQAMINQDK
ncbi:MAG: hypothetical protein JEZ11_25075 [Desulfobacterales bacterium]|nr:hypothetical protein [Desulfobacterales bacterium]